MSFLNGRLSVTPRLASQQRAQQLDLTRDRDTRLPRTGDLALSSPRTIRPDSRIQRDGDLSSGRSGDLALSQPRFRPSRPEAYAPTLLSGDALLKQINALLTQFRPDELRNHLLRHLRQGQAQVEEKHRPPMGRLVAPADAVIDVREDPGIKGAFLRDARLFEQNPLVHSQTHSQMIRAENICIIYATENPDIRRVHIVDRYLLENLSPGNYQDIESVVKLRGYVFANAVLGDQAPTQMSEPDAQTELITRHEGGMHRRLDQQLPLFPSLPSSADIRQGSLGNCYLMSSLASLADMRPYTLQEMLRDNGDGTVTVRLYQACDETHESYTPCYMKLDKSLLHNPNTQQQAHNFGDALWPAMLEKAYTLLKGDTANYFEVGLGGQSAAVMPLLLGVPARVHSLPQTDASEELALNHTIHTLFTSCEHIDDLIECRRGQIERALKVLAESQLYHPNELRGIKERLSEYEGYQVKLADLCEPFGELLMPARAQELIANRAFVGCIAHPDYFALQAFGAQQNSRINALLTQAPELIRATDLEHLLNADSYRFSAQAPICLSQAQTQSYLALQLTAHASASELLQAFQDQCRQVEPLSDTQLRILADHIRPTLSASLKERCLSACDGMFQQALGSGAYDSEQEQVFRLIQLHESQDCLMTAASRQDFLFYDPDQHRNRFEKPLNGLVSGHSYQIMGAVRLSADQQDYPGPPEGPELKFIRLRNPWGDGAKNAGRRYEYDAARGTLVPQASDKAEFLCELSDFCRYFSRVDYSLGRIAPRHELTEDEI